MEKKTKFKLNYIRSHVKMSKRYRPQKKQIKKSTNKLIPTPKMTLLKYYYPISLIRTIGDFCYIAHLNNSDGYIKFSTFHMKFKQIKEIKTSSNFTICTLRDYEEPFSSIEFLTEQLMTLNNQDAYDLACAINKFGDKFASVDFLGKRDDYKDLSHEKAFLKLLDEKKHEPMIVYHYGFDKRMGLIINKIGTNKVMKDMTCMNDMQLFIDGILLVPSNEYFKFSKQLLDSLFSEKNQTFQFYLNTAQGVFKFISYIYQFLLKNELVTVLTFPKEHQTSNIQAMYETIQIANSHNKSALEHKERNRSVKNIEDWDLFIKKYYESWLYEQGNKRCYFKDIENDQ